MSNVCFPEARKDIELISTGQSDTPREREREREWSARAQTMCEISEKDLSPRYMDYGYARMARRETDVHGATTNQREEFQFGNTEELHIGDLEWFGFFPLGTGFGGVKL